jgi:ubiquinone/menaquinone biosynthesis C-methylase UbiE
MCKQELVSESDIYRCTRCRRTYPIVLGIPDLRVYSDPYITIEQDHEKGGIVQAQAERMSFADLLRFYWENVSLPPTPVDLREGFIRHVLSDQARVESFAHQLDSGNACLDVGCGAGSLIGAAGRSFGVVIGCDVAFRWLVLARKRLQETGATANLVCCCADYLPFPPESFDLVTAISLLEHVRDAQAVIGECSRVQRKDGRVFVWTTNRFSLAPEPHVHIWGVGFLPRRWMAAYVKWRRGLPYDKQYLLSCFELRRMLKRSRYDSFAFSLPSVTEEDLKSRSWMEKLGACVFRFFSNVPLFRWLLTAISPALLVLAKRRRNDRGQV